MPTPEPPPGMRERKKIQTRLAIRREAFRLFDKQGYANTTVEQIAAAAEVSPRTLYRHFGIKEALLVSDDQSTPIVDAFVDAPGDLSIVGAYRHAVAAVFGAYSPEERDDAVTGQQMLYQVPEARGLIYTTYVKLIALIEEALARRGGAPGDETERRVMAGAIVGVLIAFSHNNPMPEEAILEALSVLESKMA